VYRESFPWVRQPGCVVNHSQPCSAEVKKKWSYTSTPPSLSLHSVGRDSFYFMHSFYASPQTANRAASLVHSFRLRPAPVPGYFLKKAAQRKIFFDPVNYSSTKTPFSSITTIGPFQVTVPRDSAHPTATTQDAVSNLNLHGDKWFILSE